MEFLLLFVHFLERNLSNVAKEFYLGFTLCLVYIGLYRMCLNLSVFSGRDRQFLYVVCRISDSHFGGYERLCFCSMSDYLLALREVTCSFET
jgi:hypothetical protein